MFRRKGNADGGKDDGYTDEQHFVAAVSEFKKLESANQSMIDLLYRKMASPFHISTKPCEAYRAAVLQCYQQLPATTASTSNESDTNSRSIASQEDGTTWTTVPYHRCYAEAMAYQRCVEKDTLSSHLAMAAAFEERGAQQMVIQRAAAEMR